MAIDYEKLLNWKFDDVVLHLTRRDTMLYALGVGLGMPATDRDQLRFVYEENLLALPTMAVVLGFPGFWVKNPETGVTWQKVLHGEESFVLNRPLPVEGHIIGRTRVTAIVDRGDKGAAIYTERQIIDGATGEVIGINSRTTIARADGGFGGPSGPSPKPRETPDRPADLVCDLATLDQAALIYRLSGDYNPLHADPDVATGAGFKRPILHGLCTFGVAGHALLKSVAQYQPERIRAISGRFSSPVYPGETIRTEIWHEADNQTAFRARVVERDLVVLSNGWAEIAR